MLVNQWVKDIATELGLTSCTYGQGELKRLLLNIKTRGQKPIIVTDGNIYAQNKVLLSQLRQIADILILCDEGRELKPSMQEIERLLSSLKSVSNAYPVALGGGTICDITKLASYKLGLKFAVSPSALSVNGFASSTASILTNNAKQSLQAKIAEHLVFDEAIISTAPSYLNLAGIYDCLAMINASIDIFLSAKITGYKPSPDVAKLAKIAIDELLKEAQKGQDCDFVKINYKQVARILSLSGLAMSLGESSFVASGGEHILAHILEVQNLEFKSKAMGAVKFNTLPHGLQIAAVLPFYCNLQTKVLHKILAALSHQANFTITPPSPAKINKYFNYDPSKVQQIILSKTPLPCFWQELKQDKASFALQLNNSIEKLACIKQILDSGFARQNSSLSLSPSSSEPLNPNDLLHDSDIVSQINTELCKIMPQSKVFRDRFTCLDI